ncbi:hypothetical protein Asulf_01153 [Archaeoglobus sulfaticallidus PM70-1]|uniref:Uncharacterized protein n=1 Tax=Archaeoglobus sulfaticallidus PM70-1 TaxID=387631 RepID=N0BFT8_9EURY|nr:hypothetical protein [Archaeoglobus sulfaticallidus]AGK61152.1 hypothetical protein Asulf_01153 [Archaeoglobus sulfaticallidus PM70-1]
MPWGMYEGGNFLVSLTVGFGIVSIIMILGFYLLIKSINDLKNSMISIENKVENVNTKVKEIADQLEEI